MTSGIVPPQVRRGESQPPRRAAECQALIERRLRETRRRVKGVDIASGLLALAIGGLAYLLLAAVIDHWLITGGMGFAGRLIALAGLVAGGGFYFAERILPLVVHRINPVFAAQTLEQSRPSLKNGLINLLFLRRHRDEIDRDVLAKKVYRGLERETAAELAAIDVDTAVDHSPLIRRGYLLAAILAICCLYLLLSPKNPLVSFSRVIWPWAGIEAPTRVTIDRIEPGDAVAFQGDTIDVSAEVQGLRAGETVKLYYTTADDQSVDEAVPMTLPEGGYRHRCDLPPDTFGLQQDVTYYLAAGDCRTERFAIKVQTALTILVDAVEYDYPDYTGIADRTVRRTGDVRAIEGTRVTIRATANRPIQRAMMEMDCDPRQALKMSVTGTTATVGFPLLIERDDPTRPQYESYQIRFSDPVGYENRRPIRHRIEVIPDLRPDIRLVDPPPEEIQLPENGALDLRVRAEDPDFALRRVVLRAERDGRSLPIRPLLERRPPELAHEGPFEGAYRFEPSRLGLKAGDKVLYWAEAYDNKEDDKGPTPNRSATPRRRITVVEPDHRQSPEQGPDDSGKGQPQGGGEGEGQGPEGQKDQPQQPDEPQQDEGEGQGRQQPEEPPQDEQSGAGEPSQQTGEDSQQQPSDEPQPGEQGEGTESGGQGAQSQPSEADQNQQQTGQQPPKRDEPIDGETNPGDAIEEILKYRADHEQRQDQSGEQSQPQDQSGEENADQRPSDQQRGSDSASPQGADQQQPEEREGDSAAGPQQAQPQDASAEPGGGDASSQQAGSQEPGGDASSQQAGAQEPSGDTRPQQAGAQEPSGGDPSQQQAGQPSGDRQAEDERGQSGAQASSQDQQQRPQEGGASAPKGEPSERRQASDNDQPGGEPSVDPSQGKDRGGAGKPAGEDAATAPTPDAGQQPDKTPGEPGQTASDQGQSAQTSSASPKDSDSQGETGGDRQGGGERGAGQKAEQSGTGTAGSQTAADQGAGASEQPGEGQTGGTAGERVRADRPTGQSDSRGQGPGSGQRTQPGSEGSGERPQDRQATAPPPEAASPSDQPGEGQPQGQTAGGQGSRSSGSSTGGGGPADDDTEPSPKEPTGLGGDDPNLEYARKQTDLALETLSEQLAKEQPDQRLLDQLGGWTKEDLERFARRWQQMRRAAGRPGPEGDAARRQLGDALRSLGLRPRSTELRGGGSEQDGLRNLRDSRRFDPPADWAEQFRAYTKSLGGSGR